MNKLALGLIWQNRKLMFKTICIKVLSYFPSVWIYNKLCGNLVSKEDREKLTEFLNTFMGNFDSEESEDK